jgi:RHH-type proline utilization regulon transcriptional repressor/proline dehydrogenase/delta 1-pyrroline-5-carboxylate dehydrogenase
MKNTQIDPPFIEEAKKLLFSIKKKKLTIEERKQYSAQLAALLITQAKKIEKKSEKKFYSDVNQMSKNLNTKALVCNVFDQAFRSNSKKRTTDQLLQLISQYGIPNFSPILDNIIIILMRTFKNLFPSFFYFLIKKNLSTVVSRLIKFDKPKLNLFLQKKKKQGLSLNVFHVSEIVIGNKEVEKKLNTYFHILENPHIKCVSIKTSLLLNQIDLITKDNLVEKLSVQLRKIYRKALSISQSKKKLVILTMENYDFLQTIVSAFKKVLEEKEFFSLHAGITLQAYLPDSYTIQQELTQWSKDRISKGACPITISIVKGSFLVKEQIVSSKKNWKQAPFTSKTQTDANFKRMLIFGLKKENMQSAKIKVATHNAFDLSFSLLLAEENDVSSDISYEMLEGRTEALRKVLQKVCKSNVSIYFPITSKEDFNSLVPYLIRRLDKITQDENILHDLGNLYPGTSVWENQEQLFYQSCDEIEKISSKPRRNQNRLKNEEKITSDLFFENEPDTDFSLDHNKKWMNDIINKWKNYIPSKIPLIIGENQLFKNEEKIGFSPNQPSTPYYYYSLASQKDIDNALEIAKENEKKWELVPITEKQKIFANAAKKLRENRGELIGALMMDISKSFKEADHELSGAIDAIEYYRTRIKKLSQLQDLIWKPKGTYLIIPCGKQPCSTSIGSIIATLISGNCVIYKPPLEAILSCYLLIKLLWESGVPKKALQFIPCSREIVETKLIHDNRISSMILYSGIPTSKKLRNLNPNLNITETTNGINSIIVTALADKDIAIKNIILSAFEFSGQKCSCASLAILEQEVYDDIEFQQKLCEATKSLTCGPSWNPFVTITPLITPPDEIIIKALTCCQKGEEWLLKPVQDPHNPHLWSPGIKIGIKKDSFFFKNDLPIPVLGLMKAENLNQAISFANATKSGLTAGLHSLDVKEKIQWLEKIEAGNCYVNRKTTKSSIRKQPFGGYKQSSFGHGYKSGGPNFLYGCSYPIQKTLPKEKRAVSEEVNNLSPFLEKIDLSDKELGTWYASISNYSYWWAKMKHEIDPSKVLGQDNLFGYMPRNNICLYIAEKSDIFNSLRICAAALTCGNDLHISCDKKALSKFNWLELNNLIKVNKESKETFFKKLSSGVYSSVRITSPACDEMKQNAAKGFCYINNLPVLSNGRIELLNYLREVTLSYDYDRYGSLGVRDNELRKPVL